MLKVAISSILLSSMLFASDAGGTDIMMRSVNFIVFVGIMYYLLADKVKAYFGGRTQSIIDEHEKVQNRLKETKLAKQAAEKKIDEAKKIAADILAVSKKENAILNEKIVKQMEVDIKNMESQHESSMGYEQRKMVSSVVTEVMEGMLSNENIPLDDKMMTDIITKKVA